MPAQRADITHAQDGVPADVMLYLETETLDVGDVSLRIGGGHIGDAESDTLPGALANCGEVAEVEGGIEKQRRLADRLEGQFVTLHAVIAKPITATHDCLLVAENVVGESEHRPELHAAALNAAREVAVFAANHPIEGVA